MGDWNLVVVAPSYHPFIIRWHSSTPKESTPIKHYIATIASCPKRSISDVLTANPTATNSKRSKTDESALLLTLDETSILALPQPELADAYLKLRTAYQEQKASIQALEKANIAAAKAVPVDVVT